MLEVKPVTGFIGAEITDVILRESIASELADNLRSALDKWHVIFIRNQFLDIPQQKQLTRVFGSIVQLPYIKSMDNDPDVIGVLKEAQKSCGSVFGGEWHADLSFLEQPPSGSVLNAIEVPDVGGDTVWADQATAYDTLPPELKSLIENREAIHVGKPYGVKFASPKEVRSSRSIQMTRDDPEADKEMRHPTVYTHPRTGRRALNMNPTYTSRLSGMTEAESSPVLDAIYKHSTKPDLCCRFRWSAGDVAVWDNCMTMHHAVNDCDGQRRLLYRTAYREDK
ncbi:MAG: TauD/TfdA family dioxygenase [Gammaproteobacteria bacterium]|nr:TauD/TfdA family dioxygenase [Gammaproteobacteria bacterium]